MIIKYNKIGDQPTNFKVQDEVIRIGKNQRSHIVLNSPFVSDLAATLSRGEQGWELTSMSEGDILVAGQAIQTGEKTILVTDTPITIYPYELYLGEIDDFTVAGLDRSHFDDLLSDFIVRIHKRVISQIDVNSDSFRPHDPDFLRAQESNIEEYTRIEGFFNKEAKPTLQHCAGLTVQTELLVKVLDAGGQPDAWKHSGIWSKSHSAVEQYEADLREVSGSVYNELAIGDIKDSSKRVAKIEQGFWELWDDRVKLLNRELVEYLAARYVKKQIKDIMFGYGPLEDLLRLPSVTEIMVVSRDQIYIEKSGVLEKTGRRFVSDEVTKAIIDRIVEKVGRRIDVSEPLVDARLQDGSRVNAVIPPIAINGPCITIRKFPDKRMQISELVRWDSLTAAADRFLRACVIAGCNILVSGGTGSGKTTLLNCLSDYIPDKDRIVTIEDTAELQLAKDHVVRMETKNANVEGKGAYDIRRLVENSLRMRPDRIVVGECRGPEALDMLQAMNTGHDGSMTTIHANTAEDVVLRLEVLVQEAADLPVQSIHRQVASAIDIVVQLTRFESGKRCVTQVTEFVDYDETEERIVMKDIFRRSSPESEDYKVRPDETLQSIVEKRLKDKEFKSPIEKDAAIEKLKQQIRKLNDDNLLELQAGSRLKLPYEGDGDLLPTGHLPSFMPKLMERKDRQGKPLLDLELFYT